MIAIPCIVAMWAFIIGLVVAKKHSYGRIDWTIPIFFSAISFVLALLPAAR